MFLVNITNIKLKSQKVENILNFAGNFKIMNPEVLDYLYNFQIENFIHLKGLTGSYEKLQFKKNSILLDIYSLTHCNFLNKS